MGILVRCVPFGALLIDEVLDCLVVFFFESSQQRINTRFIVGQAEYFINGGCVGCYSSAVNGGIVFPIGVVGVEFPYLVEVGSGWLSYEAEPAEFTQPLVNGGLQAVVLKVVVEEEPLFFPSIFGSISRISCSSFYIGRLVGHALGG
ncbi:hypothetical protein V6N12_029974 [Hibiscus sabdariffa]|uniref:Uncharacterized protein n=1 Tax=Hibiscus sabdariffa TaxID=183260 RepID=A0ABR2B0J3_9ROSI